MTTLIRPNVRRMATLLLLLVATVASAQHLHLNAGAVGSLPGVPLSFINGASFHTNSGWFLPLTLQTNGLHQGLYRGSITLTALPSTPDYGGPAANHAAPGTLVAAEVVWVLGPAGGEFGFWDSDGIAEAGEVTFRVPTDGVVAGGRFVLGEGDGSPGSDPYGHIHGRYFTATVPGLYVAGFRLIDLTTSGPGGGPMHPPSDVFPMYLQAGTTLNIQTGADGRPALVFGARRTVSYFVERSGTLQPASWETIAGPFPGDDHVRTVPLPTSGGSDAFFRLRTE